MLWNVFISLFGCLVVVHGFTAPYPSQYILTAPKQANSNIRLWAEPPMEAEWSSLSSIRLFNLENKTTTLSQIVTEDVTVLTCLSHFGDFNAWEMTQQYMFNKEIG